MPLSRDRRVERKPSSRKMPDRHEGATALASMAAWGSRSQAEHCRDSLAGDSWDHRSCQSLSDIRADLFDIVESAAIAQSLPSA